ncbi:hypothetical protein [Neisseria bergeri]|uniref:hypothetical protein n=1 Tax=Neisseria bergeri TaxID=1906581 RepID=UPI000E5930A4|nr:hypothetical protein [Neisseria bergeri]
MKNKTFTDHDIRVTISGIIKEIWGDGVASNRPENITPEVAAVVSDAVNQIKTCSKRLLAVDITYNFLYTAPGMIWEVIEGMAADMIANLGYDDKRNPLTTYIGWIRVLRGRRQYAACVNTAALNYRSRLELAFLDL